MHLLASLPNHMPAPYPHCSPLPWVEPLSMPGVVPPPPAASCTRLWHGVCSLHVFPASHTALLSALPTVLELARHQCAFCKDWDTQELYVSPSPARLSPTSSWSGFWSAIRLVCSFVRASHITHSSELACVVVGYLQETLSFCHAQCCFSLKHHQALLEARCPVWLIKPLLVCPGNQDQSWLTVLWARWLAGLLNSFLGLSVHKSNKMLLPSYSWHMCLTIWSFAF